MKFARKRERERQIDPFGSWKLNAATLPAVKGRRESFPRVAIVIRLCRMLSIHLVSRDVYDHSLFLRHALEDVARDTVTPLAENQPVGGIQWRLIIGGLIRNSRQHLRVGFRSNLLDDWGILAVHNGLLRELVRPMCVRLLWTRFCYFYGRHT